MDFFLRYKKILIALAFIFLIIFFGYLLYAAFFKPAPVTVPAGGGATTTTGGLPQAGGGTQQVVTGGIGQLGGGGGTLVQANPVARGGLTQITALNQSPSLDAALAANGSDLVYYDQTDGKFYRLTKDGQASPLNDTVFHEVTNVTWSPDRNRAILEYPDQAKIIYDFAAQRQISLPKHWRDFSFSPNGGQIVLKSLGNSEDNRWLAVINQDGTSARQIASLGDKDETVYSSWSPNSQTVAMYTEGAGYDQQKVYFVGLNEENFKALTIEGRGFEPKWSPRGDRLLYSVYSSLSDLKPELWIANAQGESIGTGRIKLDIQTWANKCVFSSATNLYCAVPEQLEEGAGLFPELAKGVKDNLYQVDTLTGLKKLVAIPDGQYTMSDLQVTNDGSYLYFTDANTGRLNKIKLK